MEHGYLLSPPIPSWSADGVVVAASVVRVLRCMLGFVAVIVWGEGVRGNERTSGHHGGLGDSKEKGIEMACGRGRRRIGVKRRTGGRRDDGRRGRRESSGQRGRGMGRVGRC